MSKDGNLGLNAEKLAVLGALDDFYDLYCELQKLYNATIMEYLNESNHQEIFWNDVIDKKCRKAVRDLCEPVMQKYLYLFTEEISNIHANAYGFSSFSMLQITKTASYFHRECSIISFASFLIQLQDTVASILHRYKTYAQPNYARERVCNEINARIEALVQKSESNLLCPASSSIEITDDKLYLYSSLTTTRCRQQGHQIIPSRYVADYADESRRIRLPVHYCMECRKFFIGRTTLALFDQRYGKTIMQRCSLDETDDFYENFCRETKLHQFGYNVEDGKMSLPERQALLTYLLEHKRMTYHEICATIEQNIKMFQGRPNYQLAVTKWQTDLEFIGQYILSQR